MKIQKLMNSIFKSINNDKVQIKNLIGIIDEPCIEDLLFEITYFLNVEKRLDEVFTLKEVSLKTKYRIGKSLQIDLKELTIKGYIEQITKTKFKLIKNLWE